MLAKIACIVATAASIAFGCVRAQATTVAPARDPSGTSDLSAALRLRGHLPGLRSSRLRSTAAGQPAYTIVADGAPTTNSTPLGFNNTGQIFGQGSTGCFVYDQGSFVRLPIPSAGGQPIDDCAPVAINDAASNGTFEVGGRGGNPYAAANYAFIVNNRLPTIYYAYEASSILGINTNGISAVTALFAPVRTTDLAGQQLFTGSGTGYLSQLQAPVSAAAPIHYLLPFPNYSVPACPFGGCVINDRNKILGYDFFSLTSTSAKVAVATLGKPESLVDLPISLNFYPGGYELASTGTVAFNNNDQILYDAGVYAADISAIYDIRSGKKTIIRVVTPTCPKGAHTLPISMNNKEEVLGFYYCATNSGYFTWDPVTGTHDLSLQIPSTNFEVAPFCWTRSSVS